MNENWFFDLRDAETKIETWRIDYNHSRGRRVAGWKTPAEVAAEASIPELSPQSSPPLSSVQLLEGNGPEKTQNRTLRVD